MAGALLFANGALEQLVSSLSLSHCPRARYRQVVVAEVIFVVPAKSGFRQVRALQVHEIGKGLDV